jgi:methionyl aminopeptidase
MVYRKSVRDVEKMRAAGAMVNRVLRELRDSIEPGKTTTLDMDLLAEELIKKYGGVASFKNYRGYPNTLCVAVNEEVVHGIPGSRVLQAGDIAGLDVGVLLDGFHGDAAVTVPVGGEASSETMRLLTVARDALFKGLDQARAGNRLGDIGFAIQSYVEQHGFSVVRDLVGHGIGKALHEDPHVPNYGRAGTGIRLEEGMTLAIEPMVNAGGFEVSTLKDRWTVVTRDGSMSAHFEHTVLITREGPDILTLGDAGEALF